MSFSLIPKVYAACEDVNGGVDLGCKFTLGVGEASVKDVYSTPADLINVLTNNLMVLAGIILFFMIILAGFKFLQDTAKGKEEAAKIMKTAIIGFIVMFSAFWIVQIIKVITGTEIIL
jgi:ABC-type Na+ efflux pump permease subunit